MLLHCRQTCRKMKVHNSSSKLGSQYSIILGIKRRDIKEYAFFKKNQRICFWKKQMFLFFYYYLSCLIASLLFIYLPTLTATFMYKDVSTLLAKISQLWILIITWIYLIWIQSVYVSMKCSYKLFQMVRAPLSFLYFLWSAWLFSFWLPSQLRSKLEINTVFTK